MWTYHRSLGDASEDWITELSGPLQVCPQWCAHTTEGIPSVTRWPCALPPGRQLELKIQMFKTLLRKIPFLQSVDSVVVEELLMRLESRLCMRWDLVVRQGDPGDWMGFIASGMIAVLAPRVWRKRLDNSPACREEEEEERKVSNGEKEKMICLLRAGACFGEPALLAKPGSHRRLCSLQALSWVQLQVITLDSWQAIVQLYPEEMEFCHEQARGRGVAGGQCRTADPTVVISG